eukprot:TRINITY_DN5657_c0_g3_i1.p1 TRINITY_DN5657_c0_g3~~TRINITY_DN5657_c0_g3_i1.p1  ORF type:complete len:205 (-),score=66.98 TRINITY_DN5657_c0_g3_i1:159-773(-)
MEELGKVEANKRLNVFRAYHEEALHNMDLQHLEELDQFNKEWEDKFGMMEEEATELRKELREQHKIERGEIQATFFSNIKEPKPNPELSNLMQILNKLIKAKRYIDADRVSKRISELKESLELAWNEKLKGQYEYLLINVENKHTTEMKSLKLRIRNAMKEQNETKAKELKVLLTKFMNAKRDLENKQALEYQKYQRFLEQRKC